MAVFRVHKTENFTVMSNTHLRDKGLSLAAKGLLSVILSLPPNWNYSIHGLSLISKEGDKAIKTTLDELKEHGYIVVTRVNPEPGHNRVRYEYDVYEMPYSGVISEKPQVAEPYPSEGVQGEPLQAEPLQAEPLPDGGQLNTYRVSTDSLKTDHSSNSPSETNAAAIKAIIDYFNERVGTRYTYRNKKINDLINARLKEHFTVEDFKTVIDTKVTSWKGTEWAKFLRPTTLFAPSHFEDYLNEKRGPAKPTTADFSDFMDGWEVEYRGGQNGTA